SRPSPVQPRSVRQFDRRHHAGCAPSGMSRLRLRWFKDRLASQAATGTCTCMVTPHDRDISPTWSARFVTGRDRQSEYLVGRLRRRSMVVLQQTTQALPAGDAVVEWHLIVSWDNQHVAQPLMVPFFVIMCHELANGSPQRGFTA